MAKRKRNDKARPERPRKFTWIPQWGWILIFLVPLLVSEYMFYRVGRTINMVLFPIAWVGFWFTIMRRGGGPIFGKKEEN